MLRNKKPTFNVGVSGCYKTSSLLSRFLNEHSVLKDHLLHTYLFYFKPPLLLCNLSIPIAHFSAVLYMSQAVLGLLYFCTIRE